jgi:sodium-independent sulfate anion transporter 11
MSGDLGSKVGHGVAKVLRLKVPAKQQHDPVTRGESAFSVGTYDTYSYVEPEPTAAEWFREILPSGREIGLYFYRLFPFLAWITRYNVQWLIGDLVAGMLPICTSF